MWYRKQLGDMFRIADQFQPGRSVATPRVKVFSGGALVETLTMFAWPIRMDEQEAFLGNFFTAFSFLGGTYSVGTYSLVITATIGGAEYAESHTLQILPGGDSKGNVIASHYNDLPEAHGVLYQRDDGTLERLSNPR
jgi:hypothetical protein